MDDDVCGAVGGMTITGNEITGNKPAPVPLSSTKNPTYPNLGSTTGRRGGEPVNDHLSSSTTYLGIRHRRLGPLTFRHLSYSATDLRQLRDRR
jgi:hypothetical protein